MVISVNVMCMIIIIKKTPLGSTSMSISFKMVTSRTYWNEVGDFIKFNIYNVHPN